jgi:hypothetical protein
VREAPQRERERETHKNKNHKKKQDTRLTETTTLESCLLIPKVVLLFYNFEDILFKLAATKSLKTAKNKEASKSSGNNT